MAPLDRLTCGEVFRRLDDYLDRTLTPAEMATLLEHLDICVVCAREYRFEERVLDDMRAKLTHLDIPPGLVDRVRAAVERAGQDLRPG